MSYIGKKYSAEENKHERADENNKWSRLFSKQSLSYEKVMDLESVRRGLVISNAEWLSKLLKGNVSFHDIMALELDKIKQFFENPEKIDTLLEKGVSLQDMMVLKPNPLKLIIDYAHTYDELKKLPLGEFITIFSNPESVEARRILSSLQASSQPTLTAGIFYQPDSAAIVPAEPDQRYRPLECKSIMRVSLLK